MSDTKTLLIVEDDEGLQKQFKWCFSNYNVILAGDRHQAIAALIEHQPKVVTLDLGLPPDPANASEGLATLKEILNIAPATKVIVVTGNDDREHAIHAVAIGAYDFYQKPVDSDVLELIIERAFQLVSLECDYRLLKQQKQEPLAGLIGSSQQLQALVRMVEKVSPSHATILLLGESGTGKEVFARAIHQLSSRSDKPFIAVNCAAIPETLLESELFGYEKGAFTGAVVQTKGKIEYAQGGTFFLDEIGDLPFALQAKLLRFIQGRVIERLGGRKEIPVDVRIICATHRNLQELITQGEFRGDLYYRLGEIVLEIPPLRDRDGDALTIANSLLQRYRLENNKKAKSFTEEARLAIETYAWPGNIREMENKIKRAVILSDGYHITADDLEITMPSRRAVTEENGSLNLKDVRETAERTAIQKALSHTHSNITETAKLLGITRPTLYSLLNKYQLLS